MLPTMCGAVCVHAGLFPEVPFCAFKVMLLRCDFSLARIRFFLSCSI